MIIWDLFDCVNSFLHLSALFSLLRLCCFFPPYLHNFNLHTKYLSHIVASLSLIMNCNNIFIVIILKIPIIALAAIEVVIVLYVAVAVVVWMDEWMGFVRKEMEECGCWSLPPIGERHTAVGERMGTKGKNKERWSRRKEQGIRGGKRHIKEPSRRKRVFFFQISEIKWKIYRTNTKMRRRVRHRKRWKRKKVKTQVTIIFVCNMSERNIPLIL